MVKGPRSFVLLCAVLGALALCCAAPALALEPAGDGWYWQSPQRQGQILNEVTFGDALNVWAVGDAGTIHALVGCRPHVAAAERADHRASRFRGLHRRAPRLGRRRPQLGLRGADRRVLGRESVATVDGGATWVVQKELSDASISDLAFVSALEGWAVGSRGLLLHTVDGGATWTPLETGVSRNLMSVAFEDAQRGTSGLVAGSSCALRRRSHLDTQEDRG